MTSWPRIFDSAAWDHTGTICDVFHNTLLPILAAGPPLWRLGVTLESGKMFAVSGNTASMSPAVPVRREQPLTLFSCTSTTHLQTGRTAQFQIQAGKGNQVTSKIGSSSAWVALKESRGWNRSLGFIPSVARVLALFSFRVRRFFFPRLAHFDQLSTSLLCRRQLLATVSACVGSFC